MKGHRVIASLVLALLLGAALPGAARAEQCFSDNEKGPATCNCTSQTITATLCTSSKVNVSGEQKFDGGFYFPGLSAGYGTKYSKSVDVTQSSCLTTSIPPGWCVHLVYMFDVCIETTWQDGWFGPNKSTQVTITYTGVSLGERPAGRSDCPT